MSLNMSFKYIKTIQAISLPTIEFKINYFIYISNNTALVIM